MRTTVLVVDDEELLRRLLSRMLLDAGFSVVDAEDGGRALEIAQAMSDGLDLVVTDINMPVMNGLELARQLRALHPSLPILFISGRDLPSEPVSSIAAGTQMLRKPFLTQVFLEAVARTLA